MVSAMDAAKNAARRAIESAYEGTCAIVEYRDVRDEKTKLSSEEEVTVMDSLPCRLSFEKISPASQTETADAIAQSVKLFLAPEVRVNSGSKIIVTQNGVTGEYSASGEPAVYCTHQEIMLKLFEGWA